MGSNLTPAMKRVNKEVLERDGGACVRCKNKVRANTIPHYEPSEKGDSKALAEDQLTADALSKTLENLRILDLEQLGQIQQDVLLLEILINFVSINFEYRFAEKIGKDRSPIEASRIIKEIQDYIRSNLYENLKISDINAVDFFGLSSSQYVDNALMDAYSIFEKLYMEE